MNGDSPRTNHLQVKEIFTNELCDYAQSVVFPWGMDKPLTGSAVAQALFTHHQRGPGWDVPIVKDALMRLAKHSVDRIQEHINEFPAFVLGEDSDDEAMSAPDRNIAIILTLDQGARYLCKGVGSRYAYEFFLQVPVHAIKFITTRGMARLSDWEAAGVEKNQAIIRALVMLGTLVHSEDPENHEIHLRRVGDLRGEYEQITRTQDPYRNNFEDDLKDVDLYGRMHDEGPPQSRNMSDVVYWMMRYYRGHVAYLRHFGRNPFQNVARGRKDTEEELEWLRGVGVTRSEDDEKAREAIREDIDNGRWRPLQL